MDGAAALAAIGELVVCGAVELGPLLATEDTRAPFPLTRRPGGCGFGTDDPTIGAAGTPENRSTMQTWEPDYGAVTRGTLG